MMRTIKVYGQLAKELGQRVFRAEVETVAEAVRFLVSNFPHIEVHMAEQHYRVRAGSHQLDESELHYPVGSDEVISITPVIALLHRAALGWDNTRNSRRPDACRGWVSSR